MPVIAPRQEEAVSEIAEAELLAVLSVLDILERNADRMLSRGNTPGYQAMMCARRIVALSLCRIDIETDGPSTFEVSTL